MKNCIMSEGHLEFEGTFDPSLLEALLAFFTFLMLT